METSQLIEVRMLASNPPQTSEWLDSLALGWPLFSFIICMRQIDRDRDRERERRKRSCERMLYVRAIRGSLNFYIFTIRSLDDNIQHAYHGYKISK